jgi:thiamine biosynthesis lipoprotein
MLSIVRQFYAMASDCTVHLCGETAEKVEQIAAAAESEVRRIEMRYSRYRGDSELTRINKVAATGGSVGIDAETAGLIDYAKACFTKSGGAFDITSGLLRKVWDFSASRLPDQGAIDALLPFIGFDRLILSNGQLQFNQPGMELDFGGLGKEYAADQAAEVCAELGAQHGFIDLGGDIRVVGPQSNGLPWRIGIRHPRDDRLAAEIKLSNGALATSGDYERFVEVGGRRYCHILNPRTGWPAQGISSVTVISDRCMVAGSLSTMAMLKENDGTAWLQSLGVRHIVIDQDGKYYGTEPPLLTQYS